MEPMVSIIVPKYKEHKYFESCIESALNQTYENLEIIVIDDANDNPEFEKTFSSKKIKVIRNERNCGLSASRNIGMRNAKGKYTIFLDDDDFLEKDLVEKMVLLMDEEDPDVIFFNAWCLQEVDEEKKTRVFPDDCVTDSVMTGRQFFRLMTSKKYFRGAVWAQCWKTKCFRSKGLYFEPGLFHEDALFTFEALLKVDRVLCTDYVGYYYRNRSGSIINSNSYSIKRKRDLVRIIDMTISDWNCLKDRSAEDDQAFLTFLDTLVLMVDPEFTEISDSEKIEIELNTLFQKILCHLILGHSGRFFDLSANTEEYVVPGAIIYVWGTNRKSAEIIQSLGDRIQIAGIVCEDFKDRFFYGHPVIPISDIEKIKSPYCLLISHFDINKELKGKLDSSGIKYYFV